MARAAACSSGRAAAERGPNELERPALASNRSRLQPGSKPKGSPLEDAPPADDTPAADLPMPAAREITTEADHAERS